MSKDAPSDLHAMKNLGRTTVQWLNAIGIHSRTQLEASGAVNAYLAMRSRGFRATRVALYSLHGALADISWREVPQDVKRQLTLDAGEVPESELYRQAAC